MIGLGYTTFVVPMPSPERMSSLWGTLRTHRRRSASMIMVNLRALSSAHSGWEEDTYQLMERGKDGVYRDADDGSASSLYAPHGRWIG